MGKAKKLRGSVPGYRLKVMDKVTDAKAQVGAGWLNTDGSITIKLNMMVVLSEQQLQDCELRLFPNDKGCTTHADANVTPPEEEETAGT